MHVCPRCSELYTDDAAFCPMDGASLTRVTDPLIGKTVAQRYRIISRLGGGGMSAVYLARHVMIDRLSAVKILRGDLTGSQAQRDRFLREARAVNRINHDCIVEITDFGEWETLVYLVMEYVPGEPLSHAIAGGPLPWQRAAAIGAQMAAALARAHQMGVVHRDIKPANILLVRRDGNEHAMLSDFGIAKILDAPSLTLTSQIFGTPGYIAPEYIEGGEPDTRSDLYSLGVVLYEATTGKLPHDDKASTPLMLQVLRDPPRPLRIHVEVPRPFEDLVMSLLSRKPEQRGRDAFEVLDRLARILVGENILAAGPVYLAAPQRGSLDTSETGGPATEEESSSKPFAHLAPLCGAGLARIEANIARRGADFPAKVPAMLDVARQLARDVSVASHTVTVEQARIAELERYGRTLRTSLGRALDDLSRDLSRVQQHLADVARRRAEHVSTDGWEHAALVDEEVRIQALADDLAGQIQALRDHLATQNESIDEKLAAARLSLEGRVAALRRVAAEAWAAIDELGTVVGTQALPPGVMSVRPPRRT